jgi:hypothetical protein
METTTFVPATSEAETMKSLATTPKLSIERRYASLDPDITPGIYNFAHLHRDHLLFDVDQTLNKGGVAPGLAAPDFELPRVGGGTVRLSERHDRPTLLRFGSIT